MDVLLTESLPIAVTAADLDLRDLQIRFAGLFDQAARGLGAHGLDQDDVVFDRLLVCVAGGRRVEVTADWLSDRERLIRHVLRQVVECGGPADPHGVRICELKVVVRRDSRPGRVW